MVHYLRHGSQWEHMAATHSHEHNHPALEHDHEPHVNAEAEYLRQAHTHDHATPTLPAADHRPGDAAGQGPFRPSHPAGQTRPARKARSRARPGRPRRWRHSGLSAIRPPGPASRITAVRSALRLAVMPECEGCGAGPADELGAGAVQPGEVPAVATYVDGQV